MIFLERPFSAALIAASVLLLAVVLLPAVRRGRSVLKED
jgi:TctA family transporter